ncbi:hypothetical protein XYCOK13_08780 [Xylanibacillus composti]|uniref:Uncharacterized protein n=1 Tax=Xylanibacillus composti TaxID=1572762 RepID=A0A8J4GZJ1_9BACL|nr:hypothetical protein XYCOK13_08780 [Xylanibacillus composti]
MIAESVGVAIPEDEQADKKIANNRITNLLSIASPRGQYLHIHESITKIAYVRSCGYYCSAFYNSRASYSQTIV